MTSLRHLSWENFRSTVLLPGQQRVHRVSDSPRMELFADGAANRIGIWIEVESGTPVAPELSRLAYITARVVAQRDRTVLEISTDKTSLQRQFFHFAVAVTERVIVERRPAMDAVGMELLCFGDLLEEKLLMGIERQIGLLGELIFLERLVSRQGADALDAWLGPSGEPHDFRIQSREFEVKTTTSLQRIHTINGLEQLVPSLGCGLYLVSVVLGPAGASAGFSLTETVEQLSDRFGLGSRRLDQFRSSLAEYGFRDTDSHHYARRYSIRRPMGVVHIDGTCPAITRPTIQGALGVLSPRVESLQYDINVDGLEHEDGTAEFEAAFPS